MIRVESLSKSFPDSEIFSDINISLKHGMRVGLVGRNGSGKTTLLRIILGEISPDSGNIHLDKSISIGYLAQEIVSSSNLSILEEVMVAYPEIMKLEGKMISLSEAISKDMDNQDLIEELGNVQNKFEALDGWKLEEKAKIILGGLGFKENEFSQSMDIFSGGWRMRVVLAAILLQEPNILFLDEPTNHLDLQATIWLESFLSKWKGAMIIISHDREFLDRSINYIFEIDFKKINIYKGNYSKYKLDKSIRLEQHRNAYRNQQLQIRETERFIERFRYKNTKAKQVQSRIKMLEKMEKIDIPNEDKEILNLVLPQLGRSPLKIAVCKNVTKCYGKIEVFNQMNLSIERGQKIGLVGKNGAGKSTLLKLLAGVEDVTSGSIHIGNAVKRSYYAQHQLEILNPDDTVFDSIQKISYAWNETKIRTYLGNFMFTGDEINKNIKVLSGGEKARVAMARILVDPSHLLLLDEPTNHLDMDTRNVIEDVLIQFTGSIICISHDRHFLNQVTNLIFEVDSGKIRVFEGNYDYYKWKKEIDTSLTLNLIKDKSRNKEKSNYMKIKKVKNRLAWIEKRFNSIETELDTQREITNDPANGGKYVLLQEVMERINLLEKEYLELIEEQEHLQR